jgi:CheY-like chemotaxis protein
VALTAHADEEHRRECEANGFDMFLAKPASLEELERLVQTARAKFLQVG